MIIKSSISIVPECVVTVQIPYKYHKLVREAEIPGEKNLDDRLIGICSEDSQIRREVRVVFDYSSAVEQDVMILPARTICIRTSFLRLHKHRYQVRNDKPTGRGSIDKGRR